MDDLISRQALYEKMSEAEELAQQRVIDTRRTSPDGNINPVYAIYKTQLNERTRFKEMIYDEPSVERDYNLDEWCTDCKEYDHEKKCCPRWNRVIRSALDDSACDRKKGKWITHRVLSLIGIPVGWFDECSECGKRSPEWRGVASYHGWNYCPSCGADMRERKE